MICVNKGFGVFFSWVLMDCCDKWKYACIIHVQHIENVVFEFKNELKCYFSTWKWAEM